MNNGDKLVFNADEVKASITGVIKAYNNLYDALNNNMQHGFIDKLAELWACGDSEIFFNTVKEDVNTIISKVNLTFESIVNSMNSAASVWAETSNVDYDKVIFTTMPSTINTNKVSSTFPDGNVGITTNASVEAKSALDSIKTSVSSAMLDAKDAVENCGFKGGMQSENLQNSLKEIEKSINDTMENLANNLFKYISDTVEKIGYVASKVSNAFLGNQ